MLDFLFAGGTDTTLTIGSALLTFAAAVALGILISFTYMKTYRKGSYSQSFVLTVMMLPAIIAIIILLVGSNVARAFSLAGAFSIVRFRSAPGDSKDITYIFFAMAAGLACGIGLVGYAVVFTALLCIIMAVLSLSRFGKAKNTAKLLKITIPEDLDYEGAFDDIFASYTTHFELDKVRTTNLGTLYELDYHVNLKSDTNEKEFIDLLRCRNGNLNIVLSLAAEPEGL